MCATLQVSNRFGNRTTRPTVNNLSTDSNSSLLLVYDDRSSKYFLVDTGSELSVIPPSRSDTRKTCSHSLIAANGSPIKTFGTRQMMLNLGLQKYSWRFIIADVTQPIIGGDFLCSHTVPAPIQPWGFIFQNEIFGEVQFIFDLPWVVIKTGF